MLLEIDALRGKPGGPFSLRLGAGDCVVISGPSGIGKSLLLRMIADLDENQGRVLLNGTSRDAMTAPQWRRQVMYVAAESGWWADHVHEHMQPIAEAKRLAPRLGLAEALLHAPVAQLSTGERQRLGLIRAIIRAPLVLLLDEPSSALDEESTLRMEALLRELTEAGMGLILVTHNEAQARRLATRRYQMCAGRLEEMSA
ncbi:MAG TPA: ATP-binding cassette domain-containing protein [Acidocella sp.]|jgi:ABC-type iron transport system FetAB ATPase subunit|nr:ATP-binding cassette domain-containing protein [Acidocella sp.]